MFLSTALLFSQESEDSMGGSVIIGATTINNQNFQKIGILADIPIWKLGFGIDIQLLIDDQGNIRKEDWDKFEDYLDKIYYIRWGRKGDPFYAKVGGISNASLGYGIILNHYSNMIQYPTYKRIGLETSTKISSVGTELFLNNFKEAFADKPGMVLGARLSYDLPFLGSVAGITYASDFNEYNGLFDSDNDGYPDAIDAFPTDKKLVTEREKFEEIFASYENMEEIIETLIASGEVDSTQRRYLPKYGDMTSSISIVGADYGIPVIKGDNVKLDIYAQAAQIIDYGFGFGAPGIKFVAGPLTAYAEYRHSEDKFLFGYFNTTYEVERARTFGKRIITKKEYLEYVKAMDGYYAGLGIDLFQYAYLNIGFQDLKGDDQDIQSLRGDFSLTKIPKLSTAKMYYSQENVERIEYLKSPSSIMGYVIGYEIASGVSMNFDYRFTFEDKNGDNKIKGDDETNKTISIYTAIKF
jgi:hypothetical protein